MTSDPSPWAAGRLRGRGRQLLLFGAMYEDVAVEEEVFEACSDVFAVAGSGDTALALAAGDRHVEAVDINRTQAEHLRQRSRGEPRRQGVADRLLAVARSLAPIAGWTHSRVRRFLDLRDTATQRRVFDQVLDTTRFRLLVDASLSPSALLRAYQPAFVGLLPPHFGRVVRTRLHRGISTHPNRTNPYARLLLVGDPPDVPRPPSGCLDVRQADAVTYLESQPAARFDGFTLSNILDGPGAQFRAQLADAICRTGTADAPVVLRSLRKPVDRATACWAARDRSMIWGTVAVVEAARFPEYVRKLL